jgi:hypothetical protein
MEELFKLNINATSDDTSKAVRCETSVQVVCSSNMAVGVIANLLQENADLKIIFSEALLRVMTNTVNIEKISSEDYDNLNKEPEL